MAKALVIRTIGDTEISSAIVDGMTRHIIPIEDGESEHCKAALGVLQARDSRYWQNMIDDALQRYGRFKRPSELHRRLLVWWAQTCYRMGWLRDGR